MTNKPKRLQSVLINSSMVTAMYQHQLFRAWIWTSVWLTRAIPFKIHTPPVNEVFWGVTWKEFLGVTIVSFLWSLQFFWGVRWKISNIWGVFWVGTLVLFFVKNLKSSLHLPLTNYPKSSAVQKITINTSRFCFFLFSASFLRQQLS